MLPVLAGSSSFVICPKGDLPQVIDCGNILDNLTTKKDMMENAAKIRVLVGGGLTFENIERIIAETGASEIHFGTAIRDNSSILGKLMKRN